MQEGVSFGDAGGDAYAGVLGNCHNLQTAGEENGLADSHHADGNSRTLAGGRIAQVDACIDGGGGEPEVALFEVRDADDAGFTEQRLDRAGEIRGDEFAGDEERGARQLAVEFREGFENADETLGLAQVSEDAEQEDADLIGVSVHSWEWTAYADELLARCRQLGIGLVLGGSVLTERDQAGLLARGADAVFGPYAPEAGMLEQIAAIVRRARAGEVGACAARS